MRVLSPILHRIVYPAMARVGYFGPRAAASVVTYHGVLPEGYRVSDAFLDNTLITAGTFRSQLRLLKRNYNVISPERFRSWVRGLADLPERAVLLTCDDGLLNNLTVMVPILQEEGLQCLFFVTGASFEKSPAMLWYIELYLILMQQRGFGRPVESRGTHVSESGDQHESPRRRWLTMVSSLSALEGKNRAESIAEIADSLAISMDWKQQCFEDSLLRQRFQLMDADQVKRLADAGMTIGSHTQSHPELARQSAESARQEISAPRRILEECTGDTAWALAYPFGNSAAVGDREFQLAQEAGYECAFMNISGDLKCESKFALPRVHITREMSLGVFEAYVSGFHERLRRQFRGSQKIEVGQ